MVLFEVSRLSVVLGFGVNSAKPEIYKWTPYPTDETKSPPLLISRS